MYKIPEEVKSGIYLGAGIYLFDLVAIFSFWFISSMFEDLVYSSIQVIYTVFNILLAIILTRSSHSNYGKKQFHVLIFKYKKMKGNNMYHGREKNLGKIGFKEAA